MTPGTDSLLRLIDHVADDDLGVNLDIGWHALQREDIPWSIHKLGNRIFNVHLRDLDGWGVRFAAPGMGVLSWPRIFAALNTVGYEGALNLELEGYGETRDRAFRWTFEYLGDLLRQVTNDSASPRV
jgi:sugar phosphate isomerase/epimerase